MSRHTAKLAIAALGLLATLGLAPSLASAAAPAWTLKVFPMPSNFAPGATGNQNDGPRYNFLITNVGGADATGSIIFTDTLPAGVTFASANVINGGGCSGAGQLVTCNIVPPERPGTTERGYIGVTVTAPAGSVLENQATLSSPGAATVSASSTTTVSSADAPFDFLPGDEGLAAMSNEDNGSPTIAAGSHPYQLTISLEWQSVSTGVHGVFGATNIIAAGGGPRDAHTYLPPGLVVNPLATPERCTEAELETETCPDVSVIGIANAHFDFGGADGFSDADLFNMVPSPGHASSFAFDPVNSGFFQHVLGGVRPGSYQLEGDANDITNLFNHSAYGAQLQLWGDPTAPAHDYSRGKCSDELGVETCPVARRDTPLLTMPTSCPDSLPIEAGIDSWGDPGNFHNRSSELHDVFGNSPGVSGCNALPFAPTLTARPTTNVADSPSGLSVDLQIPQTKSLNELATAHLRKAVVSLPEGMALNPSSANGLAGCSSAQIGIDPATGVANGSPVACPNASRIGTVEVDTPLLDHPLPGSVYVATPHDNPFDSLLAIYVVIDDSQSGTLVKLAGHVVADPGTGRLTTIFDENPQVPFEDFKLSFFGGAGGVLRTPSTCGSYLTTSQMTPWSYPDSGPPATPHDEYAVSQGPNGGACASSPDQEPNSPTFDAGSASVVAGSYSPFVLHLSRGDGSQQFASLTLTPPPGLLGKLAGTPYCPDAALAAAEGKTGAQEKANPSCPDASKVGTVTVGAGAGPSPYYAQGTAYLAGPYKGAPLSMAIVTPAVAGPYDLGTVVVRSALNVNPETAQITATSDPIPQILQGIPLDVRSIALSLDKPNFTLNGTSCDPLAVSGSLLSSLNQSAALNQRFQLAECSRLPFKPQLALRLKGGTKRGAHPALTAILTMKPGEANVARASVALPHSEFLDQGHIGTVCTRVQYAAKECPAASIYGQATAYSPLLDQPLSGPVYMRSSSHNLPDLVASLDGQIHIDLDGRIDSSHGGIRNTFEAVPDAPVSKFVLSMQGGRKGLLQNSTDLCLKVNRATALFDGQNGKTGDSEPALKAKCPKARKKGKHGHRRHRRAG